MSDNSVRCTYCLEGDHMTAIGTEKSSLWPGMTKRFARCERCRAEYEYHTRMDTSTKIGATVRVREPHPDVLSTSLPVPKISVRQEILETALKLTTGDRNKAYGEPHYNMETFAKLVDTHLRNLGWSGPALDSVDGACIMLLTKLNRIAINKDHDDSYVDGAAYLAIAGECAKIDKEKGNRTDVRPE